MASNFNDGYLLPSEPSRTPLLLLVRKCERQEIRLATPPTSRDRQSLMDVGALVARYEAVSRREEDEILRRIFGAGWEAGCWLRVEDDGLLIQSRAEIDRVLDALKDREAFQLTVGDDPHATGLEQSAIGGDGPCFLVVSQKCDIVGLLGREPFVELAPARFCADRGEIASRWKNSYREFPVDPEASETFMVDLRHRYWLPKIDLPNFEPRQALPTNTPPTFVRFRFGLRLAQRYTRAAIPDRLVELVVKPLGRVVNGDADADRLFSEWMLYHGERYPSRKPHLIALFPAADLDGLPEREAADRENEVRATAEDKFERVVEELLRRSSDARDALNLDDPPSGAFSDAELPFATWRSSWKIDLDAHTFGGETMGALPSR
jgi:hypothetical protein